MPRLTKTVVEAAELRSRQYTLWDSDLSGFGAYVHPTGRRSYFVDYRTSSGTRRRMTIGRHGVITADEARKLAIETMGGIVLQKADPLVERKTQRRSMTMAQLCDRYLDAARSGQIIGKGGSPKKASTLISDTGRVERHIKPLMGSRLVIDVTRADVTRFMRDVMAGKTAIVAKTKLRGKAVVEGGRGTAARTVGLLGGIFSYAVSEGVIDANPARGVKRPADQRRTRRLTPSEYAALGKALDESADAESWQAIAAIRLLALTGCRSAEITDARAGELDTEGQALRLGDSKTGASVRPLGRAAVEVIATLEADSSSPWLLPSPLDPKRPYGGLPGAMLRLTKRAGLSGVTAHTLRHSYASVAGDLGYAESTIGVLIGHKGHTVTSRYVHRLDAVLISAADAVAGEVSRQMAPR